MWGRHSLEPQVLAFLGPRVRACPPPLQVCPLWLQEHRPRLLYGVPYHLLHPLLNQRHQHHQRHLHPWVEGDYGQSPKLGSLSGP